MPEAAGTELPPVPEGVAPPQIDPAAGRPIWLRDKRCLGVFYANDGRQVLNPIRDLARRAGVSRKKAQRWLEAISAEES